MLAFLQIPFRNRIPGFKRLSSFAGFRQRLGLLRWLIPAALVTVVLGYELGPTYWVYERLGFGYHVAVDALIFGTVGPTLAFLVLSFLERWLDERDTSDLQAQILVQVREDAERSRQLTDEALQILFSAGTLIATLKADQHDHPAETNAQAEVTEAALNQAIQRLRSHLEGLSR